MALRRLASAACCATAPTTLLAQAAAPLALPRAGALASLGLSRIGLPGRQAYSGGSTTAGGWEAAAAVGAPAATAASASQPAQPAAPSGERVKAMERLIGSPPAPLLFARQLGRPKEGWEESLWGRTLLWVGGYYSKESQATRGGKLLFNVVMEHAKNQEVTEGLMLDGAFPSEQGFISLHIWMCLARLRAEGKMGQTVGQTMYDLFQEDVELRVRDAGVKVRVSKWLTELEQRFFGAAMAYDKALEEPDRLKSSEMLTEALWKNVYNGEGDVKTAQRLARYVRRELASLAMTPSEAVIHGQIRFSRPA
mmetsp:Transcript_19822/g.50787  ORF Transcript_19822/g.50787 Transcript_19822/m.50787 type:complete len:309 (-) Transcript_19822:477-1403(-)|eukprot:jgi/Tetstr1/462006/TSEL_007077.t1